MANRQIAHYMEHQLKRTSIDCRLSLKFNENRTQLETGANAFEASA